MGNPANLTVRMFIEREDVRKNLEDRQLDCNTRKTIILRLVVTKVFQERKRPDWFGPWNLRNSLIEIGCGGRI